MRTLIKFRYMQNVNDEKGERLVKFLQDYDFRPESVALAPDVKNDLLQTETIKDPHPSGVSEGAFHAIGILASVPLPDQERRDAIDHLRFAIHRDDEAHSTVVWGIVCIDSRTITIRLRHRNSRSLEKVTEALVACIWEGALAGTFRAFERGHMIPVREPNSTMNAHVGEILPPGPKLREYTMLTHKSELKVAAWALVGAVLFSILGFVLFYTSASDSLARYFSAWCDRIATTGVATGVLTVLNVYFHYADLRKKPIVVWS